MLGKLMKYELKATGRVFLPMFAALLVISIVNRLLMSLRLNTPGVIGTVISVVLIVGILVLTVVLAIQRFRNNLLSSEGYLMMSLPVKVDGLVFSKLFVATIWTLASFVVVAVSVLIMSLSNLNFGFLREAARVLLEISGLSSGQLSVLAIEVFIMMVIGLFSGFMLIYACMALSMLVNKRRGLFSFGAFIVITTAVQTVYAVLMAVAGAMGYFGRFDLIANGVFVFRLSQVVVLVLCLCEVIMFVVYYLVTRYMLRRRLNLQ